MQHVAALLAVTAMALQYVAVGTGPVVSPFQMTAGRLFAISSGVSPCAPVRVPALG